MCPLPGTSSDREISQIIVDAGRSPGRNIQHRTCVPTPRPLHRTDDGSAPWEGGNLSDPVCFTLRPAARPAPYVATFLWLCFLPIHITHKYPKDVNFSIENRTIIIDLNLDGRARMGRITGTYNIMHYANRHPGVATGYLDIYNSAAVKLPLHITVTVHNIFGCVAYILIKLTW